MFEGAFEGQVNFIDFFDEDGDIGMEVFGDVAIDTFKDQCSFCRGDDEARDAFVTLKEAQEVILFLVVKVGIDDLVRNVFKHPT